MSFNLIDQISAEDRKRIENYISLYGVTSDFIGLDEWLKHWSKNKIKMYKMLNNQLIYRVPFEFNKSQNDLRYQIKALIQEDPFEGTILNWLRNNRDSFPENKYNDILDFIWDCFEIDNILEDETTKDIKFKLENSKKTLQIQKGAKPIRSLGKFLTYCKDLNGVNEVMQAFEQFRIKHSMILNDKTIKGNLAISIHPLDFMTMSDNDSSWSSCMSWTKDGCYHVGTVEMMNSNNVLCCYIENSEPYYFNENNSEEYKWTNKRWRQLIYFTKDIVVGGKPYPYENENITKFILDTVRELAKKNLNWIYSFGPELYQDMKHINGKYSMDRAKNFIATKNTKKYNIIFDTRGMYNDMLNDNGTKYWCIRNKVKHTKVISYSGKAPCLCCGDPVIEENNDYEYEYIDYNERYSGTGTVVCDNCREENFRCSLCNCADPVEKHYKITYHEQDLKICKSCWNDYVRKCPDCGDIMINPLHDSFSRLEDISSGIPLTFIKLKENPDLNDAAEFFTNGAYLMKHKRNLDNTCKTIYPICRCDNCTKKDADNYENKQIICERLWYHRTYEILLSKKSKCKEDYEKYFPYNLETPKTE